MAIDNRIDLTEESYFSGRGRNFWRFRLRSQLRLDFYGKFPWNAMIEESSRNIKNKGKESYFGFNFYGSMLEPFMMGFSKDRAGNKHSLKGYLVEELENSEICAMCGKKTTILDYMNFLENRKNKYELCTCKKCMVKWDKPNQWFFNLIEKNKETEEVKRKRRISDLFMNNTLLERL